MIDDYGINNHQSPYYVPTETDIEEDEQEAQYLHDKEHTCKWCGEVKDDKVCTECYEGLKEEGYTDKQILKY